MGEERLEVSPNRLLWSPPPRGDAMTIQSPEPIVHMTARLDEALKQAGNGLLKLDTLIGLYDDESVLEQQLIEQAGGLAAVGVFSAVAQHWAIVAEFNDRLASILDLLMSNPAPDDD